MATNFRKAGIHGQNLPAKKTLRVQAAQFSIGGLIGETERKYNVTFDVKSTEEYNTIYGSQNNSGDYLPDAVQGFFDNAAGVDATLYVQSYVGYDTVGDAIDAVVANRDKADDGADADAYVVKPAYLDELEYGTSGNRTGTFFEQTTRVTTEAAATCAATGVSVATLDSVAGMVVGDLILFATAGGASPVYKIIIAIDESANTVTWSGNFEVSGGSGETLAINDTVSIPGFTVKTYRKSINGVETEVDTDLGKIICSTESAVTDYFVDNVFKNSSYIQITGASASTLGDRLPADDTAVVYCTSGANGTTVNSVEALNAFLPNFDTKPIRFLAAPETTDTAQQAALITYSIGREDDNPIVMINCAEDQTKAQLKTIGSLYQKSNFQPAILTANWLEVDDPFASSTIAPPRTVPNVGHVMGAWIKTIERLGIHYVPATINTTIAGATGVKGDQFLDDDDRTELIQSGVNVIQEISGVGIKIGNWVTVSTALEYQFGHVLAMINYIKVSFIDSFRPVENTPNTLVRINAYRNVGLAFMRNLWNRGSTGSVPLGETFAQEKSADGTLSTFDDHVEIQADIINNPSSSIQIGNQNYAIYFSAPPPAQSIRIGVGPLLL